MLRVAIGFLVAVSIAAAGLYWDRGRIADKLEGTQALLRSVKLDAALKSETIDVLRIHSRELDNLRQDQRAAETEIRNAEGFNDAASPIILDAICSRGMC